MSRSVIPPNKRGTDSPSQKTINALDTRLSAAEVDTKQLIDQLTSMGFGQKNTNLNQAGNMKHPERDTDVPKEPITPYKARIADMENMQDNYETLVSRVCKTESAIQSMKLNMVNIRGQKDLKHKNSEESEEKYINLRDACEKEIAKYKRAMQELQDDFKQESQSKVKLEEEIKDLRGALSEASDTRVRTKKYEY